MFGEQGADRTGERPDRRVTRTRRALEDALTSLILEKGYEAVTVQDIVDRANVGRSTFYAHFVDKDDLLLASFHDIDGLRVPPPGASVAGRDGPVFAFSLEMFRHANGARRVYKSMVGRESGALAQRELDRTLDRLVREELARLGVARRDRQTLDIAVRFAVAAFMGLLVWWLDGPEDLAPEQIDQTFRALTLPGLAAVLGLSLPSEPSA